MYFIVAYNNVDSYIMVHSETAANGIRLQGILFETFSVFIILKAHVLVANIIDEKVNIKTEICS